MSQVVAVFGGRSEIGLAVATRLAPGATVVLAARPGPMDEAVAACRAAGAVRVETIAFDADDIQAQPTVVAGIEELVGPIDVAVLAFGVLGDQSLAERDSAAAAALLHTDFVAQAALLTVLAARMRERGGGTLVAFSSVAGARVRRANYVYGSAKAGLDGFASGMADALHGSGVHLIIARPGFVIGRMTAGMEPAPFSSTPDQVADATVARIRSGRGVDLWIPGYLGAIMAASRFAPRWVWRRLPR